MRRTAAWALALVLAACDPAPRTQVMVIVTADEALSAEIASVRAVVRGGPSRDALDTMEERTQSSPRFPFRLPVIPRERDVSRVFDVEIVARDGAGSPLVTARALTGFVEGETRSLVVHLSSACREVACEASETCDQGACRDAFVPPEDLPPYVELDGGADGGADGGVGDGGIDGSVEPARCGDGERDPGEACDDGVNDGSYGGCSPGCGALGPRCGDGEVQSDHEACDGTAGCGEDCVLLPLECGDGVFVPGELCPSGDAMTVSTMISQRIAVGDYDGDGHADLAVLARSSAGAPAPTEVFFGRGDASFEGPVLGTSAERIGAGDFDGDGRAELVLFGGCGSDCVRVMRIERAGPVELGRHSALGIISAFAVGHVDEDGMPDLVVGSSTGEVSTFLGGSPGLVAGDEGPLASSDPIIAMELVQSDAGNGLAVATNEVVANQRHVQLYVHEGGGTYTTLFWSAPVPFAQRIFLESGDVDGDALTDVVATGAPSSAPSETWVLRGTDGTSSFQYPWSLGNPVVASELADFDADGDLDLAIGVRDGYLIATNDGAGMFEVFLMEGGACPLLHMAIADLDADGAPDVILATECGVLALPSDP